MKNYIFYALGWQLCHTKLKWFQISKHFESLLKLLTALKQRTTWFMRHTASLVMGLYNFIWIKHVVSDTNIFFDTCLREKKISKEGPAKKCFSQHEGTNIAVTLFIPWITVTALPLLFTHTHQRSNVYTLGAQSTQVYYTNTLTSLTLIWLAHLSCWFTGFIRVLIIMISF